MEATDLKLESFEQRGRGGREEEHPRKVSIVDLETTSSHLPRRLRWMGRNADRREGCGWTNGWTDSRAHRWRVAQSEKGCWRIPMALHRRELQPHRWLCAPDGYRGATRVVAGGGATSIGGLLPVVLAMFLMEGWIGARFHARRSAAPCTSHMRHAARRRARDFYAFAFRISTPGIPSPSLPPPGSRNWHRESWLLRFRVIRGRSLIVTIFNWKLFREERVTLSAAMTGRIWRWKYLGNFQERYAIHS